MEPRELVRRIMERRNTGRCARWLGNPEPEALAIYLRESGADSLEALQRQLGDDIRWITPQHAAGVYQHPEGRKMRWWKDANPMGMEGGPFAHVEEPSELDAMEWPDPRHLRFDETLAKLRAAGDCYRMSGFWAPFFHDLTYMFGTEELLVRMHTHPDLVRATLERVCGFYLEANERFLQEADGLVDALFFASDFGTQRDLMMSPEQYREFFHPWVAAFADQARRHGLHTIMHSCGAIAKIIPMLIEAGVDCIHPLQTQAAGMDADSLAREFKADIAFMGGVDTQRLLIHGSPQDVGAEVRRLRGILAPNYVVSPSHEVLMANVPFQNAKAMMEEPQ